MPISPEELKRFKALESSRRRPPGDGVLHPDQCPQIKIQGVPWAIPPRGQRLVPQFTDDGTVDLLYPAVEEWPEVVAVLGAIKLPDDPVCSKCGQPTETAFEATESLISALFALAARALRTQYDLDNADLTALLGFSTDHAPGWLTELIQWGTGAASSAREVEDPLQDEPFSFAPPMMFGGIPIPDPDAEYTPPPPQPSRRKRRRRRNKRKRAS